MTVSTLTVVPETTPVSGTAPCAEPPLFYLGTHQPHWLARAGVPLFVSDRRLRRYRTLPRARTIWALDSGGFTELSQYGTWTHGPSPAVYARRVRRYRDDIGRLVWAAPQDWMCEPFITAKTGLSVAEHQARTVDNYRQLVDLAPDLPWVPVVQGWTAADYLRCVDRYAAAGVDLAHARLVGVGSVCRRQGTTEVGDILTALHRAGVTRLHGFGFKTLGLARHGHLLTSADSMAWSAQARREPPLPGCSGHRNCANCLTYALRWRSRILAATNRTPVQLPLFDIAACGRPA
ncbi:hypothetical protein Val02_93480 [Virgisporangium aliadipatigenens]|uniref:DeoxyPurine in DNA protein A domain-containing protein n=1 Tax=Virgisporangium aliadipatigenens TaxID=741659 RepID=A0A8J3YXP6_9ACTN|nr:hypothetical protein [Virgisporangium aliadipatigenens]GIJ52462.1 hypothetical protein Val02_93480 [Virgisporangium aliadipatigenens]